MRTSSNMSKLPRALLQIVATGTTQYTHKTPPPPAASAACTDLMTLKPAGQTLARDMAVIPSASGLSAHWGEG